MGSNPYEAPREDPPIASRPHRIVETADGMQLAVARRLELPRVCLLCGTKKRVKRKTEKVYFVSPVAWVSLLFGLTALVAFKVFESVGLVKSADLELPRCQSCAALQERAATLQGPIVVGLMVFLLAGATLAGNGFPVTGAVVLVLSLFVFGFAVVRWGMPKRVKAARIDDDEIVLRGVHPDALKAIVSAKTIASAAQPDADQPGR